MRLSGWESGYHYEASDWIDGKHFYLNIEYFKPGSSLHYPVRDEGFLLRLEDLETFRKFPNSIVRKLMENQEFAKKFRVPKKS